MHQVRRVLLVAGVCFVAPAHVRAGTAQAEISCVSAAPVDGALITIKGEIPGDNHPSFALTVTHGEKSVSVGKDADRITVVQHWKDGVFTVSVDPMNDRHALVFHAIPSTIKTKSIEDGAQASFTARAERVPIPGYTGALTAKAFFRDLKMTCQWSYSV